MELLILGAGYLGAAMAGQALAAGDAVTLADNWTATDRAQLGGLEAQGASVVDADIRERSQVDPLVAAANKVILLAAQASRPLSVTDPDYTEETNVMGVRRVGQSVAENGCPPLVFGSSLHVYGPSLSGEVGADTPYGEQGDLAHLSKIYGEQALGISARRAPFDLAIARLGIIYGPSPVEHARPESQTVIDRFRRQAAAGEEPTLDDGGRATIGAVHVDDAARILLSIPADGGVSAVNVAGDTLTVADVAALATGGEPAGEPAWKFTSPFDYEHSVASYLGA